MRAPSDPVSLPIRQLVQELISNGTLLVRRQVKLAELESRRQLRKEKTTAELLGAGGMIAYAGVLLLLAAAALAIGGALADRYWLGAILVGGALLVVAGIVGALGYFKRVKEPLPRSRRELRRELTWAKTQLT